MRSIIEDAVTLRKQHMACGIPMLEYEGFKEASIAHAMWLAFFRAGYWGFPEFPYQGGSIDAVFVREDEVWVCEWKRLNRQSTCEIVDQTARMMCFDPSDELPRYRFKSRPWRTRRLWVCDAWESSAVNWWLKKPSTICTDHPLCSNWLIGKVDFESLGKDWYPYTWLWAYTKPPSATYLD